MSNGETRHTSLYSYCKRNNPVSYLLTESIDENIKFLDENNKPIVSNFVTIISIDSPLYICPNDTDEVVYIPSGHVQEISYQSLKNFTILGDVGQKYRWYVQNY